MRSRAQRQHQPPISNWARVQWRFGGSMDRSADLEHALAFVIDRIEEEATRSGYPLTDKQRALLNDLPRDSVFLPTTNANDPENPPLIVPRDFAYERLIALARDARRNDHRANPASDLEWKFAVAVSSLNRHPISWLLRWAGMKQPRPWWDSLVLIGASILFVVVLVALILFGEIESGTRLRWVGVGIGCIAMLLLLYFASRHIEEWQLMKIIEKYRNSNGLTKRVNC
jgi:hypothetical protein